MVGLDMTFVKPHLRLGLCRFFSRIDPVRQTGSPYLKGHNFSKAKKFQKGATNRRLIIKYLASSGNPTSLYFVQINKGFCILAERECKSVDISCQSMRFPPNNFHIFPLELCQ